MLFIHHDLDHDREFYFIFFSLSQQFSHELIMFTSIYINFLNSILKEFSYDQLIWIHLIFLNPE